MSKRAVAWLLIVCSGAIEIAWAVGLKVADSVFIYVIVGILLVAAFFPLSRALKVLPVSIAYTAFTGIGTVGLVLIETLYFEVPMTPGKLFFIVMIMGGIVGLKFTDSLYSKEEDKGDELLEPE